MIQECLSAEASAETLDAAVLIVLSQMCCSRAEADIEVLQVPSSGYFGLFGRRLACVRIKLHDRAVIARQITKQLLRLTELEASIELASNPHKIELHLASQHPSLLIGRHGQTLDALQDLVVTMTDRVTTERTPIVLDVGGYRERRRAFLQVLSRRLCQQVRQTSKPVSTPPLVLSERRILHELINREPDLESHSKNHQSGRKTIILQPRG